MFMKRMLTGVMVCFVLFFLGLVTYRVYIQNASPIPLYETNADPHHGTENDRPNTPIIIQSNNMPSEEKVITLFPEYIHAHRIAVGYGAVSAVPDIPGLSIRLVDVTQDGRCPDGAVCSTAGWATVIVEVTYKEHVVREELYVQGGAPVFYGMPLEKSTYPGRGNIVRIDQYMLFAVALNPRPTVGEKPADKSNYVLTVFVDTEENVVERKHLTELAREELQQHITNHQQYYIRDIINGAELHSQTKKIIFHDPMKQEGVKYAVGFSWKDGWTVTGFETQQ